MELPQDVQKDIVNFQALQNQFNIIQTQLAQIDAELRSIFEAISALEGSEDDFAYKAVGPILVRERKSVLLAELKDRKETLEVKKQSLAKKSKQLETKLLELKKKIEAALANLQQVGGNAPTGG